MAPAGTPLLLLPGSLCDARLFRMQVSGLNHRQVCVGNIGREDSVEAIAADVLMHAPRRFAVAGLSMGGIIALEIWRQAPARVAGMALLDTTFVAEAPEVAARRATEAQAVLDGGTAALRRLVRDTYLPKYLATCNRDEPGLQALVLQMAAACGPAVLLRQWRALSGRPDSRSTLPTIDCPALVACGVEDRLCPPAMHREMAALMGAPCHVIDGCGHLSSAESPRETTELIVAWLRRVDARERERHTGEHDVAC